MLLCRQQCTGLVALCNELLQETARTDCIEGKQKIMVYVNKKMCMRANGTAKVSPVTEHSHASRLLSTNRSALEEVQGNKADGAKNERRLEHCDWNILSL